MSTRPRNEEAAVEPVRHVLSNGLEFAASMNRIRLHVFAVVPFEVLQRNDGGATPAHDRLTQMVNAMFYITVSRQSRIGLCRWRRKDHTRMYWPMDGQGWVDVAVQCLPYLIETMKLMKHVKPVVIMSARWPCIEDPRFFSAGRLTLRYTQICGGPSSLCNRRPKMFSPPILIWRSIFPTTFLSKHCLHLPLWHQRKLCRRDP